MSGGPAITPYPSVEAMPSERMVLGERLADYLELSKARIAAMVLLTVTVGFVVGSGETGGGPWRLSLLASALAGTALVAASGGALNQLIERNTDARMARTANRPLPSGRLRPAEVAGYGLACGILGIGCLAATVNATTAVVAAVMLFLYVAVYTPLKRYTAFSTAIGAVPGALPPVLGWVASGAPLNWGAFSLFAILYIWQFPHFLAIAWLYRRDYAAAGLRLLPGDKTQADPLFEQQTNDQAGPLSGVAISGNGPSKGLTGLMACAYAAVLIPVSLLPGAFGLAGGTYRMAALFLGFGYLAAAARFCGDESRPAARGLLYFSLVYLPILLSVLTWDHVRLLS